jgi:ATP-dependent exoDNAse (exonuclease V) beta subunit
MLINIEDKYVRKTNIGKFGICDFLNEPLIEKKTDSFIFLQTKYKQFLWVKNNKKYILECDGVIREMMMCKIVTLEQMLEMSPLLKELILEQQISKRDDIETIRVIYARCVNSMNFLDKVYRDHVYKIKFNKNDILAIKSVAGSGKTTTLLELSKIHNTKKILYIAFNKSLITEIRSKIQEKSLRNLFPTTFDALMRDVFINKTGIEPNIADLKPQTLPHIMSWFINKPYRIKNYYISNFKKFCNQTKYSNINEFSKKVLGGDKKLLINMWDKSLEHELITFDSIRKMVEMNHWCKDYLDNKYDMIFIDESQDFDNTMLKILLEDTTIPKIFVGDPKQAIYEWKGCINAFDKLPESALTLEFYSTFRVGSPACDEIRNKFDSCWMISKSKNETYLKYDVVPTSKYVYLFRSWKNLLKTAQNIPNIWIYNYDVQIEFIKKLHAKLQISNLDEDELNEFSDDLPKFLLKLSLEELEKIINDIEGNMVPKNMCMVEMYTIHSYKGLESDIIRIFNDIDIRNEQNLYYVALTRGMKEIILDNVLMDYENEYEKKKQTKLSKFGINKIV